MPEPAVFVVNLDLPPSERWRAIIRAHRSELLAMYATYKHLLDALMPEWTRTAANWTLIPWYRARILYYGEIQGIAEELDIQFIDVLGMQLIYETHACSTSVVVAPNEHQAPVHMRTMDWDIPELKRMTIQVNFTFGGQIRASVVTWAGFIGVLTGMVPHAYSCSVNFRQQDGILHRNLQALMQNRHWPVSYVLRDTLLTSQNYEDAVSKLLFSPLVAPTYFIVAGTNPLQGVIISRNRDSVAHTEYLHPDNMLLVQTNIDHYNLYTRADILDSKARRAMVFANLELANHPTMRANMVRVSLRSPPCHNALTIYMTEMIPDQATMVTTINR
jgi:hypothetical protein